MILVLTHFSSLLSKVILLDILFFFTVIFFKQCILNAEKRAMCYFLMI